MIPLKQKLCPVYVLIAGTLWGFMGMFVRHFQSVGLGSIEIAWFRVFFGMVIVGAYLALFHRELLKVRFRDLWCFVGTGIGSLFLLNLTYYSAMEHVSLAVAGVLLYTSPAFVMILGALLFREKITLESLSDIFHLAPAYICRFFHQKNGISFRYYLQNLRLEYAANLLRSSDMSIAAICQDSGFTSAAHFSKVFREKYGLTPSLMRKETIQPPL